MLPANYIENIPIKTIQEEIGVLMDGIWERYFWEKGKLSDEIYKKTEEIKNILDIYLWDKTENMKKKFGYLLFTICDSANKQWIDLAEAFETVKDEIDDRLGDNEYDDKPHLNGEEQLLWFTLPVEK